MNKEPQPNKIIFKDKKKVDDNHDDYIKQLNPLELIAYEIAKSRLKTSFDIEKSIGFIAFKS
jgi:hypothetical protein